MARVMLWEDELLVQQVLADLLVAGSGRIDPRRLADGLDRWEREAVARGSADLLGPSTRAAIQAVRDGVPPEQAGTNGTTNGAAMRIAPVGVAVPPTDVDALVDVVEQACLVSHHTSIAVAGAAAVAAVVSAGVEGMGLAAAVALGVAAARAGAKSATMPRSVPPTATVVRRARSPRSPAWTTPAASKVSASCSRRQRRRTAPGRSGSSASSKPCST